MKTVGPCFLVLPLLVANAYAESIDLGTAASLGVLGASTVINAGPTHGHNDNIYRQVANSAIGTTTSFQGSILADQSIALNAPLIEAEQ